MRGVRDLGTLQNAALYQQLAESHFVLPTNHPFNPIFRTLRLSRGPENSRGFF